MAMTPEEKRQRRIERQLETFRKKSKIGNYATILDICAKTWQKLRVMESADDDGIVCCITCGKVMQYNDKNAHGGHFISRVHTAAIINEPTNVNPQCGLYCNGQGGKPLEYRQFIVAAYGEDEAKRLEGLKHSRKYTLEELAEMRVDWLERIRKEQKRIDGWQAVTPSDAQELADYLTVQRIVDSANQDGD